MVIGEIKSVPLEELLVKEQTLKQKFGFYCRQRNKTLTFSYSVATHGELLFTIKVKLNDNNRKS
jgi:hypothetical protein